jgi:lipoyl(octanoyl) transferase
VRTLERVIIATLADFDIEGGLIEGLTGVWAAAGGPEPGQARSKIASIGVKISRGVCYHGLALNINTDLKPYEHIVPCGIANCGITSMQETLGAVDLELVAYSLTYHLGREMGFRMTADGGGIETVFAGPAPTAVS